MLRARSRRSRWKKRRRRGGKVSGAFRFLRGAALAGGGCGRSPPSAFGRRVTLGAARLGAARLGSARLRHGPARLGGAPALRGAPPVPRLRAAAGSPPLPHGQPELRQQGPHGARTAELLPHPPAQVFGSSGQDRHVQERRPQHVHGEESLHRPRHLHHRLRAPGFPPQLQPQRPLALQGPAPLGSSCVPRKTPTAANLPRYQRDPPDYRGMLLRVIGGRFNVVVR